MVSTEDAERLPGCSDLGIRGCLGSVSVQVWYQNSLVAVNSDFQAGCPAYGNSDKAETAC